jgi:imidazolonepropionase-like amidohydrolase
MKYAECHGHIALGKGTIEEKLHALKCSGVNFFRDGGDRNGAGAGYRKEFKKSGIDFRTPIYAIYRKGRYGEFLGQPYENPEEYRLLLDVLKAKGADFIKLLLSGIASFEEPGKLSCEGLEEEEIAALIEAAHDKGFAVMAHCNGADTIHAAIKAGADSIEHGIFIDEEGMDLLAESKTIWVPTITAVAHPGLQEQHRRAVELAAGKGVIITCGSDNGASSGIQGESTLSEYKALLECGLAPAAISSANEAIRTKFRPFHV